MPLSGSALGDMIVSAIEGVSVSPADGGDAFLKAYWEAIGGAIVSHITANALVLPTALISGAPGSPVTGTGTVE